MKKTNKKESIKRFERLRAKKQRRHLNIEDFPVIKKFLEIFSSDKDFDDEKKDKEFYDFLDNNSQDIAREVKSLFSYMRTTRAL